MLRTVHATLNYNHAHMYLLGLMIEPSMTERTCGLFFKPLSKKFAYSLHCYRDHLAVDLMFLQPMYRVTVKLSDILTRPLYGTQTMLKLFYSGLQSRLKKSSTECCDCADNGVRMHRMFPTWNIDRVCVTGMPSTGSIAIASFINMVAGADLGFLEWWVRKILGHAHLIKTLPILITSSYLALSLNYA